MWLCFRAFVPQLVQIYYVNKIALRAPLALAVYHLMLGGHDSRITGAVAYYGIFMHTIPEWFGMTLDEQNPYFFFFFWL